MILKLNYLVGINELIKEIKDYINTDGPILLYYKNSEGYLDILSSNKELFKYIFENNINEKMQIQLKIKNNEKLLDISVQFDN